MNICIYGSASSTIDPHYITETVVLGEALARAGYGLIFGGGANGLMGAAARGFYKGNGSIVSIVPSFFNVDGVLYDHADEVVYTETMRERKKLMEDRSDGFVVTPGGIGTLDEFFEIFTLRHLNRHTKPIAILNTDGYYDTMLSFLREMAEKGFLRGASMDYLHISDTPMEIVEYLNGKLRT